MKFSRSTLLLTLSLLSLVSPFSVSNTNIATVSPRSIQQASFPRYNVSKRNPKSVRLDETDASIDETDASGVEAPCYDSNCSVETNSATIETPSRSSSSQLSSFQGQATQRLGQFTGPTVWSEFGRIASENPSIANLGQGFPDWLPPQFAIDALVDGATDVAHNSPHQYTRPAGHPKLVNELAGRYSKHLNRVVDGMNEVAITVGASQALYLALQTLIKPGMF